MGHDGRGALQRLLPAGPVGQVAQRVDAHQPQRGQIAARRPPQPSRRHACRPAPRAPGRGPRRAARRPRAGRGRWRWRARPAGPRRGDRAARARRPGRASAPPTRSLADDHDVLAGVAQQVEHLAHLVGRSLSAGGGGQVGGEGGAAAGGEAQRQRGVGVQRRGAGGGDRQLHAVAAHALADAQVDDRHVVDRLGVEHQHRVGELEVGHRGLQARVADGHAARRARRARAGVQVRGVQALAHDALQQEALLVGGAGAGQRADRALGATERLGGLLQRALPGDGAQLAAVADHRRGDALVDVDGLVGEAAAVAQPAVVDLVVVAGEHAQDALVADGERDVALARAQRADRARLPSMSHGRARKR